eukprot:scaffold301_cov243-Pinguiococcus_pyrenoidosus.AAC.113
MGQHLSACPDKDRVWPERTLPVEVIGGLRGCPRQGFPKSPSHRRRDRLSRGRKHHALSSACNAASIRVRESAREPRRLRHLWHGDAATAGNGGTLSAQVHRTGTRMLGHEGRRPVAHAATLRGLAQWNPARPIRVSCAVVPTTTATDSPIDAATRSAPVASAAALAAEAAALRLASPWPRQDAPLAPQVHRPPLWSTTAVWSNPQATNLARTLPARFAPS